MLVFSRKVGEAVMLGDNIKVLVVSIDGDRAKIGFEADKQIPINRLEIFDSLQKKGFEFPCLLPHHTKPDK